MTGPLSILIIEDDPPYSESWSNILKRRKYAVTVARTVHEAMDQLEKNSFDIVLLDLTLPDGNGMDILKSIANEYHNRVLIISGTGDIDSAVQAIKTGAFDFLVKPVNRDVLLTTIEKIIEFKQTFDNYQTLRDNLRNNSTLDQIIFRSKKMQDALKKALDAAQSSSTILLTGDTGTGKELIAHAIHNSSKRKDNPFIIVNCAAIPEQLAESELFGFEKGAFTGADKAYPGKFLLANHGSLFLDEISELSESIQSKLLRVLESGEISPLKSSQPKTIDVRIIAASNKDLQDLVESGHFRNDLFYRIEQIKIEIPALKERKMDIVPLAKHFLNLANITFSKNIRGFDQESQEMLTDYQWPGNVRELKNTINEIALFINGPEIKAEHLPPKILNRIPFVASIDKPLTLKEMERQQIIKVLEMTGYNIQQSARLLGITRPALYQKIEKFGIKKN